MTRKKNDRKRRSIGNQLFLKIHAIQLRHRDIEHQAGARPRFIRLQKSAGRRIRLDIIPFQTHQPRQRFQHGRIIVDQKNRGRGVHAGTSVVNGNPGAGAP